jgi:hypothetical protein
MKWLSRRPIAAVAAVCGLLALSLPLRAQTTMQFPTTPWSAYAPAKIQCGWLYGANFNVTTDQLITISIPSANYILDSIEIDEVFPVQTGVSLTTAVGGFYTGAGKTGVTVVANTQAYSTITTNAVNTTGNAMKATLSTAGLTTIFNGTLQSAPTNLYLSLTTPQGAAAKANVRVFCSPLY